MLKEVTYSREGRNVKEGEGKRGEVSWKRDMTIRFYSMLHYDRAGRQRQRQRRKEKKMSAAGA